MRRLGVCLVLCSAAAIAAVACAHASSVFVVSGRGWGHGIGMSQWGADGYARHGWPYRRILRHYYPGTRLARLAPRTVRVLLGAGRARYAIACAAPIRVVDGAGRRHRLPAGTYRLGPRLRLPVGRRRVRARAATARRHRFHVVAVERPLAPPLVFDCPAAPLRINGSAYHGLLVIHRWGGRLASVDVVPLEEYLRGVVGGEMPSRWSLAALEAQAVAARSYALATLKPRAAYDLYDDTRSQVYGGIDYESARTDLAVRRTAGRILTWRGRPAATFFFSTSGGRTAAVHDVWPAAAPRPYLRSVPDPYDRRSPHHRWGPIGFTPAQLAARLGSPALRHARSASVRRNGSGRASAVTLATPGGARTIGAARVEARLGLRSTWFRIGRLSLRAGRERLVFGGSVVLRGGSTGLGRPQLQALRPGGWRGVRWLRPGRFAVRLRPGRTTRYRLASRGVAVAPVTVDVAPRLLVRIRRRTLIGRVAPAREGRVAVERRVRRAWRVVARPALDRRGRFALRLRRPGTAYRVVAGGGGLAAATARVAVRSRLLAAAGR